MLKIALAAAAALMILPAAAETAAIDNEWVTVRDLSLMPGGAGFTTDAVHPYVILMPEGGVLRQRIGARQSQGKHAPGDAIYGESTRAAATFTAVSGKTH